MPYLADLLALNPLFCWPGSDAPASPVIEDATANDIDGVNETGFGTAYAGASIAATTIPGEANALYEEKNATGSAAGLNALWNVERGPSGAVIAVYTVDPGNELYLAGEILTITGSQIGGVDGTDDLTFTVEISPSLPTLGIPGPIPGRTAMSFDGVDDRVQSSAQIAITTAFTFVATIRLSAASAGSRYFAHLGQTAGDYHPLIASFGPNGGLFAVEAYGSAGQTQTGYFLAPDVWERITFAYEETSPGFGTLSIYAGDTLIFENPGHYNDPVTEWFTLGGIRGFGGNDGLLDMQDVAFFDFKLSLAEVQALQVSYLAEVEVEPELPVGTLGEGSLSNLHADNTNRRFLDAAAKPVPPALKV